MRLPQMFLGAIAMTAIALCWVHQQVSLVTLSYQIAQKERKLSDLILTRSQLEYRVLSLESPTQLEKGLHKADRELSFVNPVRVVRVDSPQKEVQPAKLAKGPLALWDFLVRSVEAKDSR